jgi:hypothetical protein
MANRYWVGGSGTWDNVSILNWSATSGGLPLASAPTAADTVIFDSASGTGTCTTAAGATCTSVTLNTTTLGLTLGAGLTMSGAFTLTTGTLSLQTFTLTCGSFLGTNSNVRTIAFGTGNVTTTGSGSVWAVSPVTNLTVTGTPVVNVNNNTATATNVFTGVPTEATSISFNFLSGTYTLTFLSGNGSAAKNVNFTGFAGTWAATGAVTIFGNLTLSTGMTLTASASALTFGATSGTQTITTNGKTVDFPLTFNGVGGTFEFADALTQGSTRAFTITNGTVKLKNGTTNTVGSFATGAGTTQRFLQSTVAGTQATISDASGTNSATYLTVQDIAATGGATWNAFVTNNNVDAGNNTGWDFHLQSGRYMYNVRKSKRILL